SLDYDPDFSTEQDDVVRAMFYGLGADGTVGANKNSIKIIGDETDNFAQGYFVYDSKKAGAMTVSHLRFGPRPIHSTYLINKANFVGCHQQQFIDKTDVLKCAAPGAIFLLNTQTAPDKVWDSLNRQLQQTIIDKKLKLYVIDAYDVAQKAGMGTRINTIMQTCFFAISGVLPRDEAIKQIKKAIEKTYGKRGEAVVKKNFEAVDMTVANLHEIKVPQKVTSTHDRLPPVPREAPDFVQNTTAPMIAFEGDSLPVSRLPSDGTFPTNTARWEKRNIALEIPVWDPETCIQCNKCSLVCPHAAIRPKAYDASVLEKAPKTFKSATAKGGAPFKGLQYTLQIAPEDCTGCGLCIEVCPAKNKSETRLKAINMAPQRPILDEERKNYEFFLDIPDVDRRLLKPHMLKDSQFMRPLFEYSGACAGCGETPYVKLISQLFGDRTIAGNATGCSSIYGGNLPTTPWAKDKYGRGPTWSNSLFEDCAEFALGFRLTIDKHNEFAKELLDRLAGELGRDLVEQMQNADQSTEEGIEAQRQRVARLREKLEGNNSPDAKNLLAVADALIKRSVWAIGGDGWAYDIGYGGLDHVLAMGRNVNILVLDTEVYSNTGGQMSKSTPCGAVAKFAAAGKPSGKKDLGRMAMAYGNVYVAQIALGANDNQAVKAIYEAESYEGASIIIAYSHCIAHGINMRTGNKNQKAAVESGHFPLYRFDPRRAEQGLNPLQLDSKPPRTPLKEYAQMENRYMTLMRSRPERAEALLAKAQKRALEHYQELVEAAEPWETPEAEPAAAKS
ncbi:MAG: pyruvate:ferredoxin (flavodoxin) oxidoreductase, partial [Phycisphaerales bacterium]